MPQYDPDKHHRRSIRLPGYDYAAAGAYFVTICVHDRACLFGEVALSEIGAIVVEEWLRSEEIRQEIVLDAWVIMPNHMHGIVIIEGTDESGHRRGDRPVALTTTSPDRPKGPRPKSLASFMAGFKSAATKQINILRNTPGMKVWQRSYYEHIIRDDDDYIRIRAYIEHNPARWAEDRLNPIFHTNL